MKIPEYLSHALYQFFVKLLIPAIVMVSVGIMVKMSRQKITLFNVLSSYVIGVGFAWVFGPAIYDIMGNDHWAYAAIGLIALLGERIGTWIIYRFSVDEFFDWMIERIKRFFNGK